MDSPAKVKIAVGGRVYEGDLENETRFDPTNPIAVSDALAENPGRYVWWAALTARARRIVEEADNRKGVLYAELFTKYSEGGSGKGPTVEATKALVTKDKGYQEAMATLAEAREHHGLAVAATDAFEKRQEALLEVSRYLRKEMDSGMRDSSREVREAYHDRFKGGS